MDARLGEAKEIVDKINKGEGNIAKFINDDKLYKEAMQTLKDVQGAINDFREQAPILTFGSFIFSSL